MRWVLAVALCLAVVSTARADDWGVHRAAFDPVVVRRYESILARDPHDARILRALVTLYRRYRSVAKLEAEYRDRLGTGDDWATLVVLARLPRTSRADTLALWKRALAAKPDDARGWLAAGDAANGDPAAARDFYRRAAELITEPRKKRIALTKLVEAARLIGDTPTIERTYEQLVALAPKDGSLWFERGTSQLAAKHYEAAATSFATAEPLLRRDPERRLTAIVDRGMALEGLGRPDDAIAEYDRALDRTPRGYYLRHEIVLRIVDVERKRHQLLAAVSRLETRWPARRRGYFEWATLGDLHAELGDDEGALDAYQHAVRRAPTEIGTQRRLIALLDKLHPERALAQHEAAARIAPGDVELQVALAKRYYPAHKTKAFATLARLSRRMRGSVNALSKIAELYEVWDELPRAIGEYEAISKLEPDDPDHAIVLGNAYWRANKQAEARRAWNRLDEIGTPAAVFKHAQELSRHELWTESIVAYTNALELDGSNGDVWYGRARAYDELHKYKEAIEDARHAVALIGYAQREEGLRNRQLLVRELGHAEKDGERLPLRTAVTRWRFAFEHGDVFAGYLLAAHHSRIRSHQLHDVLVRLYRMVPTDDALGMAVSRSFERRGEFDRAREELERIARRSPARVKEVARQLELIEAHRERYERDIRWAEEGRSSKAERPDIVGRDFRIGMRLVLGADVHDAAGALSGFGYYLTSEKREGSAYVARLDWTKRNDKTEEVNAFALAGGVVKRIVDARKFELALVGLGRFELRYHRGPDTPWRRVALAGDLSLQVLPRAIPATLGVRFDQVLTDKAKSSAVFVELGFEVR